MSLVFDNPVQPVLAMPPDLAVWQQCESQAAPAGRWRIYLNQLGLGVLQPWFQEESGQSVQCWPTTNPIEIWQVVDGLALMLGQRRIVVMLTETIEAVTLQVPQEWVDIPGWTADYYIAAQVDIDEQRLGVWGYATHAQVKVQGIYEPCDRTYTLRDADLIQDFSVFWVAQQFEQPQAAGVTALPSLSESQAEQLIERLAKTAEPRLDLPFDQWGALLSDARWQQQLWQQRQGIGRVNLGRWVRQVFDQGWQSLESLRPQTPALGFRSGEVRERPIVRGKSIRLNPPGCDLLLLLRVSTTADNRRSIGIQLLPSGVALLPNGVTLTLDLPDTAEHLQTVQAGEQDNYIQLPSFCCPVGQPFRVSVQFAETLVQEDFMS
jgi:hypothetical protein